MVERFQNRFIRWFSRMFVFIWLVIFAGTTVTAYLLRLTDKNILLSGMLGALVGALLALVLGFVGWVQLDKVSQAESTGFILNLKGDFFKDETRLLVQLIDNDWLKFVEKRNLGESYFQVDDPAIQASELHDQLKNRLLAKRIYSVYDLDDLLLGHFEDLGLLEKEGLIRLEMIYGVFSWYIEVTWENREIQKYVRAQREEDEGIYEDFEYIYGQCHEFGEG